MEPKRGAANHSELAQDASHPSPDAEAIPAERRENGTKAPQTYGSHNAPLASRPRRPWFLRTKGMQRISFLFEGIIAVVTVGGFWFLWRQSDQTERATMAAQRQVEITDRAWVQARAALNGPFYVFGNDVTVRLIFATRNTGRSVANDITVTTEAFGKSFDPEEPMTRQRAICDVARQRPQNNIAKTFGSVLFPDEEELRPHGYGISDRFANTDFSHAMKRMFPDAQQPAIIVVVGCITYWYESSERAHQTGFIYEISRRPSVPSGMSELIGQQSFLELGKLKTMPFDQIILSRFSGGFYAD